LHDSKQQNTRSGFETSEDPISRLRTFYSKKSLALDVCEKVLSFRSFHKIQKINKTIESKVGKPPGHK
jgi:hypothetical protein